MPAPVGMQFLSFLSKNMIGMVTFGVKTGQSVLLVMDEAGIEEIKPDHKDFCYKRAQEEVDKVALHDTQVIGTTAQVAFTYVTACMFVFLPALFWHETDSLVSNEALRMYPPLPTNGPRPVEDIWLEIMNLSLPPFILPPPQAAILLQPEVFNPERWLVTEPGEVMNRDAFIPFSYGYANCVRKQLAMQEMLTLTAVQKFDV
ncbi:hypothetical protein BDZ89DRAFT_1053394, partial [Hymenopellis radicata]